VEGEEAGERERGGLPLLGRRDGDQRRVPVVIGMEVIWTRASVDLGREGLL
jgi:hypothetical protein